MASFPCSAFGQLKGVTDQDCARGEAQDDALCGFPIMLPTQRLVEPAGCGAAGVLVASTASKFLRASA